MNDIDVDNITCTNELNNEYDNTAAVLPRYDIPVLEEFIHQYGCNGTYILELTADELHKLEGGNYCAVLGIWEYSFVVRLKKEKHD